MADDFSPGLRTLCIASADISEEFYRDWKGIYYTASTSIIDRERKIEEAAELIEKVGLNWAVVVRNERLRESDAIKC